MARLEALELALRRAGVADVAVDVPLAPLACWRIGGSADVLAQPASEDELAATVRIAQDAHVPWVIIGASSNLLFDDDGFRGLVILLGEAFSHIRISGETVHAEAGALMTRLAREAARAGLAGLEHAANIPGTFGGLVVMNGGSNRRAIGEVLTTVRVLDDAGVVRELAPDACGFSYRTSIFQENGAVVLAGTMRLTPCDAAACLQAIDEDYALRAAKFPLEWPSCGSVFKSLPHIYERHGPPGKVLEDTDLKGTRVGGALVSPKHANFFINAGGARSADMLGLIRLARERVHRRTGFWLECEVRYVSPLGEVVPAHLATTRSEQPSPPTA